MNTIYKITRHINRRIAGKISLFALSATIIAAFAGSAQAAVYAVTTTADSGAGSLRAAVATSNAAVTEDIIYFSIPATDAGCTNGVCTITLTSGEIVINRNYGLTVAGTGAGSLVLSGNNVSRIFNITGNGASAVFTLDGVTVTKSKSTYGGAIYSANYSTLITNSIFDGNTATGGSGGGAISCNNPRCTITNTTFTGNTAPSGNGGAVVGASVANSIFTGNSAAYGGAIYEPQVTSSGFTISNSTFSNNSAQYAGAVYFDAGGTDYVTGTTFSGNTATSYGGAVYEYYCDLHFSDATFSGNSTSNGNGGAFYDRLGSFYFTNSTVSGNSSKFDGGGIYAYTANVYNSSLLNTIVAANTSTTGAADYYGPIQSLGYNIIGDNTGATITGTTTGNQIGTTAAPVNPMLAPLAYNGGITLTRALLAGSPAINAGVMTGTVNNVVPTLDQRGAARVNAPDIGAFEASNPNFAQTLPSGNTTLYYNSLLVPDTGTFAYLMTSGTLPPGLTLAQSLTPGGTLNLTGTPTQIGTFTFTVTGTNGITTTTTVYTITIGKLAPTAAGASISGRVLSGKKGLANARVELTGTGGTTRAVMTNAFGNFSFGDVEAGATYIVNVSAKRYTFAPQVVSLTDNISGLTFTTQ